MTQASEAAGAPLRELASVPWRELASAKTLARRGRFWTWWTAAHTVPFLLAGVALLAINPLAAPVAIVAFAHAWVIPELYAFRGASVIRPKRVPPDRARGWPEEGVAQGLLGDLLSHKPRELQRSTGLALERGELGVWLVGEAGAFLVEPGGARIHCFCVRATDSALPPSDRIAHLLLALRTDERGFATVANHAFSGAPWRLRRRIDERQRPALQAAREAAAPDALLRHRLSRV
jgi:hypothetical protein